MIRSKPVIFLAVLLAGLIPFLWQIARPFLTSFLLASILCIVMSPAEAWIARFLRPRGLATFVTTFLTVLVVALVSGAVGFTITRELTTTYNSLNHHSLEEGGWPALATKTADRVVDALATRLPINKEEIQAELITRMKSVSGYLLRSIVTAVGGVTSVFVSGLLVTLFLYFLLKSGEGWIRKLAALTPLEPHTTASIMRAVNNAVVANVSGMFAVAVGQGFFLALGFWFASVRSPVLWGTIGGLASVIPVVGAPLVWLPVVIAFVLMGQYGHAALLGLWCAFIVGSVDNILRPFVIGSREKQHPVLIGLAAIGGTYAFGPLGFLIGPVVIALAAALLREIQGLSGQNAHLPLAGPGVQPGG